MIQGFSGGLLNRQLIYQTDLPSFQRDFASLKSLNHGTGPNITFTRASDATFFDADGVLQTAGTDVPRFDHDPATGASRGLLIEEARTNLYERSAEFDDAFWGKNGSSITADVAATTAPDGSNGADKVVENNANSSHHVGKQLTLTNATNYTLSVFAKADERTFLNVALAIGSLASTSAFQEAVHATFDLSNGTLFASTGTPTTTIQNVGNGWYRLTVSKLTTQTANTPTRFSLHDGTGVTYTGDGTSGLYIWGAQLEAGAFPTSYIPTTSAAATRAADVAYVTPISSFYNETEGTLFVEQAPLYASGEVNTNNGMVTFGTAGANFVQIRSTGVAVFQVSSSEQASLGTGGASARGAVTKRILAYKADDFAATGSLLVPTVNTDTSGTVPTNLSELRFGRAANREPSISNHFAKIAYWPKRLTNTLLEQLTT